MQTIGHRRITRNPAVFSHFIRQHVDDQIVLAFTELPETRKIEGVVATISNAEQPA